MCKAKCLYIDFTSFTNKSKTEAAYKLAIKTEGYECNELAIEGAFTMAYGGFMWAFLTCQDPQMWTIMVWLYDFQGRYAAEPGMCMASFALASIPTLLVFLFCQKIIMRGIVIPTMK